MLNSNQSGGAFWNSLDQEERTKTDKRFFKTPAKWQKQSLFSAFVSRFTEISGNI
jgi:2-succinyl-5-enolpyruvyl-6-hydroxy-3-cyclohexene-1-carboxylate synthase